MSHQTPAATKPGPQSAHQLYPQPIGVMTATSLSYRLGKPRELLFIELRNPGADGKRLVLPGGIFGAGLGEHRSQRDVMNHELLEEAGLGVAPGFRPIQIAISQRLDVDPRRWCSFATINGANDAIMMVPVTGDLKPQDTAEVRRAVFRDICAPDFPWTEIGRGHELLVRLWQVFCARNILDRDDRFNAEDCAAIAGLSTEHHVLEVQQFNHMIFIEMRRPYRDPRLGVS